MNERETKLKIKASVAQYYDEMVSTFVEVLRALPDQVFDQMTIEAEREAKRVISRNQYRDLYLSKVSEELYSTDYPILDHDPFDYPDPNDFDRTECSDCHPRDKAEGAEALARDILNVFGDEPKGRDG